jgi:hypothetical protein
MIFNWRVNNLTLPKTKGTTMKKFVAPLLTVAALVAAPAFADSVITVKLDVPVSAGQFLNMDGASGPHQVMDLLAFCVLNDVEPDDCSQEVMFDAEEPITFQLG